MKQFDFYFDFLSPFSYFAWLELKKLPLEIHFRPTPLGPLLNHWGIKGPGEVTPKREFLLKQCLRFASLNGIPFTTPKTHPFNSLYALRLASKAAAGDLQKQVIATLWKAGWQDRIDMGGPDELLQVLLEAGLPADELYEKSFSREAKSEVKANIEHATSAGVFGVPSFVASGELFWGKDSIPDLLRFLEQRDPLDREKLADLLASTPRGALQQIP
jgi:2-hydroxychromene-2-carboxylate isomerase